MIAVRVRSRIGNVVLGFIGLCYAAAAPAVLVWYSVETWRALAVSDLLLLLMLLAASFTGVVLLRIAAQNLLRGRSEDLPNFFRSSADTSTV